MNKQHKTRVVKSKALAVDVLLINPPDDFSRYPYLGLCQLAAVLRERGVKVRILDSAALGLAMPQIISEVARARPMIVGISTMSMMLRFCYEMIRGIREACPDAVVVVGGAHIDGDYEILAAMGVRYGFRGECEYAFADFCEAILGGREPGLLPGLVINEGGTLKTPSPAVVDDLDALPMPAYDLLPLNRYYSPSTNLKTISYITARGCPYNCAYCSKLQQKSYRGIAPTIVVDHMQWLVQERGMQWIEFVDEIFTLKRERVLALCREIVDRDLRFEWGVGTRADRLDEKMVQAMWEAGCRKISFGIESGVERVRLAVNKRISNEQIREAVRICRKYRIKTLGSFILGLPTETTRDMWRTIRFAWKLPLNFYYFHRLIPIPNSEVFDAAKRQGSIEEDVWTKFMLGRCSHPLYQPEGVSARKLDRIYRIAWISTYSRPANIWRNRRELLSPAHLCRSLGAFTKLVSGKRYHK